MKRVTAVAGALLLAAGLSGAACEWIFGEERRIRARLEDLAETISLDGPETSTTRMARAARIGSFFTESVTIELGRPLGIVHGRGSIVALAATAPVPADGAQIEFVDVQVWMDSDGEGATTRLTAKGSGTDASGEDVIDARELEMTLRKVGGTWLIDRVRTIDPLESPFDR